MTPSIARLFDLHDRTAIVTGAAHGIGAAIAERLAEAGAYVVVTDVESRDAELTVSRIRDAGGRAQFVRCDVSRTPTIDVAVAAALDATKRLDVLVNNAGVFPMMNALELDEATWDRVQSINLKGTFFFAQRAARAMAKSERGGSIVNIASIDAFHPSGALAHYDASKGGVVMMTKSLAFELAAKNIRVNAIAPGAIDTPGAAKATGGTGETIAGDVAKAFAARIPMKRMGTPDDIARAALFLASPASDYVTGATLVVDGGYLLS